MTGPERQALALAIRCPHLAPRQVAKLAGVRLEVAKRIIEDEERRRAA
jgi:hypothetical protein